MPLIRLLLNNSFWLLLIALVIALYVYYSSEGQTVKSSNAAAQSQTNPITSHQSSKVEPSQERPSQEPTIAETKATVENSEQATLNIEPSANSDDQQNTSAIESATKTNNKPKIVLTPAPIFPGDEEMEQVLQTESPPPVLEPNEALQNKPNQQTTTTQNAQPQVQPKVELLQQARQAVEQGNLALAQNRYMQLLQMQPSANLLGEIANQLYRLGHQEMAEYAWVEAFNFLLYERRFAEAQQLSSQLQSIAPRAYQMIVQQFPQFSPPQSSVPATPNYGQNRYSPAPQTYSHP